MNDNPLRVAAVLIALTVAGIALGTLFDVLVHWLLGGRALPWG